MSSTERRVKVDDGVELWVKTTGSRSRPAVALCHGGPGLWDEMDDVAAMIDDIAYVIQWDQRGAGRSDVTGPYSVARFIQDLECIRVGLEIDHWTVGGHSWGAGLALRYALIHGEVTDGLIYVSGTDLNWAENGRHTYHQARLRRLGDHAARWLQLRDYDDRTPDEARELDTLTFSTDFADRSRGLELAKRWGYDRFPVNREVNAAIVADSDRTSSAALAAECERCAVPAFVIHGEDDPRPSAGPRELARRLPGATFTLLPEVGHVPWAEHPDLFRTALRTAVSLSRESSRR